LFTEGEVVIGDFGLSVGVEVVGCRWLGVEGLIVYEGVLGRLLIILEE